MQKNFVEFVSPGSFIAEATVKEIDFWDTDKAVRMANYIHERYGATPYAFQFLTRARDDNALDSKVIERSVVYYLGGKVETLEEVEARNDPGERILRDNMRVNKWKRVITNTNSYRWTRPLNDDDVVLDYTPPQRKAKEER